jgi:hypothetical protein
MRTADIHIIRESLYELREYKIAWNMKMVGE